MGGNYPSWEGNCPGGIVHRGNVRSPLAAMGKSKYPHYPRSFVISIAPLSVSPSDEIMSSYYNYVIIFILFIFVHGGVDHAVGGVLIANFSILVLWQ